MPTKIFAKWLPTLMSLFFAYIMLGLIRLIIFEPGFFVITEMNY